MRCTAKSSRSGEQCKRDAIRGGTVCATHGGRAPQVKAAAAERVARDNAERTARRMVERSGEDRDPIEHLLDSMYLADGLVRVWGAMVCELEDAAAVAAEAAPEFETREVEVYRAHLRGLAPETLAATYEMDTAAVRKIIAKVAGSESAIEGHLRRIDAAVDELALVAAREDGSARVSAIKARTDLLDKRLGTLRGLGLAGTDAGALLVVNRRGEVDVHPYVREYQVAVERRARMAKLCVDAGVQRRQMKLVETQVEIAQKALEATLESLKLDPDDRQEARRTYARHLRAVA